MGAELPMPQPPLRNDGVALRPWSERDIAFSVAACSDALFERFTAAIPSPYGEADAREWLASLEPARRAGRSLELAIVDASSGAPLGAVALSLSTEAVQELVPLPAGLVALLNWHWP